MLLTVNRLGSTNMSLRRSGRLRRRRSRAGSGIDRGTLARASSTCHSGGRVLPVGRAAVHSVPTSTVPRLLAAPVRFRRAEERIAAAHVYAAAAAADRVHIVGLVAAEPVPEQRRRRTLRDLHAGAAVPLETILVGARRGPVQEHQPGAAVRAEA